MTGFDRDEFVFSRKDILTLIICSQVAGTCMTPYPWHDSFESQYDCMIFGYEESLPFQHYQI
mgnify:CR=1 FL=1